MPAAAAVICAALCGCGGGDELVKYEIGGQVQLNGQPVKAGNISFVPADGVGPTAGGVITDGQYTVEVPPGPKKVEISSPKVVGQRKLFDAPDSPTADITEEQVPAKYNKQTTLTVTIEDDRDDLNFTLE
jgi:hypothetical protein